MTKEKNNNLREQDWRFFYGDGEHGKDAGNQIDIANLPDPPPWRKLKPVPKPQEGEDEAETRFSEYNELKKRWQQVQDLAASEDNQKGLDKGRKFRIVIPETDSEESEDDEQFLVNVVDAVNAAIYLRRPLLVTGNPGSGKTSLAYAIAYELNLGSVLTWAITARSDLRDGLYRYDAIARLQDSQLHQDDSTYIEDIGQYITLGAVGTAFLPSLHPRVLLIDEIDKSDINLPNDLLHLFEEGKYEIPELVRWTDKAQRKADKENKSRAEKTKQEPKSVVEEEAKKESKPKPVEVRTSEPGIKAPILQGRVHCSSFPIVIMTSNGERDFPPAFVRRCLRVRMPDPRKKGLETIIASHFKDQGQVDELISNVSGLIDDFLNRKKDDRATDQLLNAIYIRNNLSPEQFTDDLQSLLLKSLQTQDTV